MAVRQRFYCDENNHDVNSNSGGTSMEVPGFRNLHSPRIEMGSSLERLVVLHGLVLLAGQLGNLLLNVLAHLLACDSASLHLLGHILLNRCSLLAHLVLHTRSLMVASIPESGVTSKTKLGGSLSITLVGVSAPLHLLADRVLVANHLAANHHLL